MEGNVAPLEKVVYFSLGRASTRICYNGLTIPENL